MKRGQASILVRSKQVTRQRDGSKEQGDGDTGGGADAVAGLNTGQERAVEGVRGGYSVEGVGRHRGRLDTGCEGWRLSLYSEREGKQKVCLKRIGHFSRMGRSHSDGPCPIHSGTAAMCSSSWNVTCRVARVTLHDMCNVTHPATMQTFLYHFPLTLVQLQPCP